MHTIIITHVQNNDFFAHFSSLHLLDNNQFQLPPPHRIKVQLHEQKREK